MFRQSFALTIFALAGLLLLGGCFETSLNLVSPDSAKVDLSYVGDWTISSKNADGTTDSNDLIVRNFDGKQYYVEWKEEGGKPPRRMRGIVGPVNGASFAQLTTL